MNTIFKKLTKGIIISLLLIFALNLSSIQMDSGRNEYVRTDNVLITSVYAADDDLELPPATPAANAEAEQPGEPFDIEKFMTSIQNGATYIHRFFAPLVNFFSFNIGNFLSNDHIYGGAMGIMLKKIWVVSRNLVNIAFVLILLFLALKEIFWIKEEGGTDLKKSLLTFVLLLVAVNFSWLVTKVVLDAANIATNVVFAIPMGVSGAGAELLPKDCDVLDCQNDDSAETQADCAAADKYVLKGSCYPSSIFAANIGDWKSPEYQYLHKDQCTDYEKKYQGNPDSAFNQDGSINPNASTDNKELQNKTTFCWETMDFAKYDQNTSVIYLTYGMARIQNITGSTSRSNAPVQVSIAILFSLIIQAAYTIALMALFIALVIRMAVLWIFVAFSPFMVLMLFTDVLGSLVEKAKGTADFSGFLKWAFVPVKVAAVFTISFLMVSAGQSMGSTDVTNINTFSASGANSTFKIFNVGSLFMNMGGIEQFIWLLITLVVLWIGVFAVLGDMPIIKSVTDKMKEYGTSTAGLIAKAPYWAPIMPMVDPSTGKFKFGSYAKEYSGLDLRKVLTEAKEKAVGDNLKTKAERVTEPVQKEINDLAKTGNTEKAYSKFLESIGGDKYSVNKEGIEKLTKSMDKLDADTKRKLIAFHKDQMKGIETKKPTTAEIQADEAAREAERAKNAGSSPAGDTPPPNTNTTNTPPPASTKPENKAGQ